jgi:hypothetical protein
MPKRNTAFFLTLFVALGFLATAGLHGSAFPTVSKMADAAPPDLAQILRMLWLAFAVDLVILGFVTAVVAFMPGRHSRVILAAIALMPAGAAALQMHFLGFSPPTAALFVLGGLALCAAGAQGAAN